MHPFMLLIGPMYQAALLIITALVTATYAVTDRFAMNPADGVEQAEAYYAVADPDENGMRDDMLVVRLPSGEVFTTVDPGEIFSGSIAGPIAGPITTPGTRRFELASKEGGSMDCELAGFGDDRIESARCTTADGRVFEL